MFDIRIRPERLHAVSGALSTTSAHVGEKAGYRLDGSLSAAAAYPDWAAGPALQGCAQAWQTPMASVVQQLQTYAEQLRDSAHSYDAANEEAVRRFDPASCDLASRDLDAGA